MTTSPTKLLKVALGLHEAQQPVIAVRGDKSPYRAGWNQFFTRQQTEDEVREQFSNGVWGIARVLYPACNYVHLDFDGEHAEESWRCTGIKLPDTARLSTPSGGFHLIFKVSTVLKNTKTLKRTVRIVEAECECVKDGKPHPCGVDFLLRGYSLIPPSPGYREDPDFPLECAVELPDELVDLALKHDSADGTSARGKGKIPHGKRNVTLLSIGGVHRRQGMEYDELVKVLWRHNESRCRPPLEKTAVEKIAQSLCRYEPAPEKNISDESAANLTDLGNAKRFAVLHVGDVLYSAERKKWVLWNNKVFEWDFTNRIIDKAEDVLKSIYDEAARATDKEHRISLAKHAAKTESRRQIDAMLALAQTQRPIRTRLDVFDRKPFVYNAANVTIDLVRGEAREFRREDYITKISPTRYDPKAQCPLFEAFMSEITLGRQDLVDFIQRATGYSLTGSTKEQCIFILYGPGGNGKSTLALTLAGVWGTDYAQQIKAEILCQSKYNNSDEYHIAELAGVRIALACESELRRRLASALIKQWTGGEPLVGRRPYELPIRFTPIAKLWFSTNHLPKIDDTTDAIWRRIYTIPFDAKFDEAAGNREKGYEAKLLPEASGILNWMIRGCLDWQDRGLDPPEIVLAKTRQYREEEDLVANFIQDRCIVDRHEWVSNADLYQSYSEWCEAEGETPETATAFGRALREKGFSPEKYNRIRGRQGLRLRNSAE